VQVADLLDKLSVMDAAHLRRAGESGLCSSAVDLHSTAPAHVDLHKTGPAHAARPRRFVRSRSHQSLLRLDVRAAAAGVGSRDHGARTAAPRLVPGGCVRGARDDPDRLSAPIDSAIRASASMILQICGIDVAPPPVNKAKSHSLNV